MYLKYRGVFFSGRFLITLKIRTAFTSAQEPKISLFFIKRNAMSTFDKGRTQTYIGQMTYTHLWV